MNRSKKWFGTFVAAQILFLLAWAGYHEYVRQSAPVILLQGRPVDPRDILRGDYLTMSYVISDLPKAVDASGSLKAGAAGTDVWVLLEKRDRHHVAVQASKEKLIPGAGQVLVRGNLEFWSNDSGFGRVNYGIERYFVPEGMGNPRFKTIEIEVSVSAMHRLYIKRVLLDGKAFP